MLHLVLPTYCIWRAERAGARMHTATRSPHFLSGRESPSSRSGVQCHPCLPRAGPPQDLRSLCTVQRRAARGQAVGAARGPTAYCRDGTHCLRTFSRGTANPGERLPLTRPCADSRLEERLQIRISVRMHVANILSLAPKEKIPLPCAGIPLGSWYPNFVYPSARCTENM